MRVNTLGLAVAFVLTVSGAYAMNGGNVGELRTALRNLEAGFTGPKNLVNTEMQLPTNLVAMSEGLLDAGDLQRLRDLIPSFNSKKELFTRKSKTTDGKVIVDLLNKAIRYAEGNPQVQVVRAPQQRGVVVQNPEEERAQRAIERNAAAMRQREAAARERARAAARQSAAVVTDCPICSSTAAEMRASGAQLMQTTCCHNKICTECVNNIRANDWQQKCPFCRHAPVELEPVQRATPAPRRR